MGAGSEMCPWAGLAVTVFSFASKRQSGQSAELVQRVSRLNRPRLLRMREGEASMTLLVSLILSVQGSSDMRNALVGWFLEITE
jgi:hypothetical protein